MFCRCLAILARIEPLLTTHLTRTYNDSGRLTGQTFGNSVSETVAYNNDGTVDSIAGPGGTFSYSYDENKNRTDESITGLLSSYSWTTGSTGFDEEDRLVDRDQGTGTLDEQWDLSLVGDWDSQTVNSVQANRTFNDVHEVLTIGASSLTHDTRGNLTTDDSGRLLSWDTDGFLGAVDVDADSTDDLSYTYDALNRRVSRNDGTTTLVFVSNGNNLLAEYTSGTAPGSPERNYIYGQRIDEPIAMLDGSDTYYYHADASTSIRALTDDTGSVEELYAYSSYGTPTILAANGSTTRTNSSVNNRFLFTAREWDDALTSTSTEQTDLYYFRARYLSPTMGRFISRDPLTYIDGGSLYRAYFVPNGVDPFGDRIIVARDNEGLSNSIGDFLNGGSSNTWYFSGDHPVVDRFKNWPRTAGFFEHYEKNLDSYCLCDRDEPLYQWLGMYIDNEGPGGFFNDLFTAFGMWKHKSKGGGSLNDFGAQVVGSFRVFVEYKIDCKTGCKSIDLKIKNVWKMGSLTKNPWTGKPLNDSDILAPVDTIVHYFKHECSGWRQVDIDFSDL